MKRTTLFLTIFVLALVAVRGVAAAPQHQGSATLTGVVLGPDDTPVQPLIALPQSGRMNGRVRLFRGQHKYVDEVLAARINEHSDVPPAQNVQASANQGKTVIGKIFDWRSEVELAIEPRLYRVLVRRSNVGEMAGLQRTDMGVDEFGSRKGWRGGILRSECSAARPGIPGDRGHQEDRSGQRDPSPRRNSGRDRSRGRGVQFHANVLAQPNGSPFVKAVALEPRAQRFLRLQSLGAFPASFEMAFEFGGTRGVQFAIDVPMQRRAREITTHDWPPAPEV